jgi:hypothetical protein
MLRVGCLGVGGDIGEHLRVIGRPIPAGRIPGEQRLGHRHRELLRPAERDHRLRLCRDEYRARGRRAIGRSGFSRFGGLGSADEAVDADADEEEQDEAAGDGGDEHGAAAASGGVHPGVLPDEIRITRQVHHTHSGRTAEGQAVSRRTFRAVRAVSRNAMVAVTAFSNIAHCSPDRAGPMVSGS